MADDRRELDGAVENHTSRNIKRAKDSIDGVDLISSLPDAILQHIFSQIPTKYAIRTSALSKRWRHVWSETPSLDIDCYRDEPDPIYETLSRSYSSPKIATFRLSISTEANQIDRFIDFAVSRDTEELSLEFRHSYAQAYRFPEVFFTSRSLKNLSVESATIDTIPGHVTVSWRSLRTLCLRGCDLSDEACVKILSGSPLLECLTLFVDKLELLDLSECLVLKRLDVQCWEQTLKIVAPRVSFLSLTHSDESRCVLLDVSSLIEANVNIYCSRRLGFLCDDFGDPETGLADSLQVLILEVLEKLRNVEKLTLCGTFCLQILSLAVLCGVPFPMFKVEALTLETAIYPSIVPGVAKLIQNSPRLKKIKFETDDCKMLEETRLTNYLYWKGLETRQCWKPKELDGASLSEPGLMSSVMKFLVKTSGDEWYKDGSYTFSLNKNSELSFVTDLTREYFFR
ncbi:F-box domain-containing protein [Hirschfeldia incana]|nr:F-box domain-containing protein [Hirschfeldia incana]